MASYGRQYTARSVVLVDISERIAASPVLKRIVRWTANVGPERPAELQVRDSAGSLPAFLLHALSKVTGRPLLCILPENDDALYLHSDLERLVPGNSSLFPPSDESPFDLERVADPAFAIQRADVLHQLKAQSVPVIVCAAGALQERVPAASAIREETSIVESGSEVDVQALVARLAARGFQRTEFVEQPGDLAWRGGILDVYPFVGTYPIRIEFFGDDVESIREFDVRSQRSVSHLPAARIVPNLDVAAACGKGRSTLFDYLSEQTILAVFDPLHVNDQADALEEKARELNEDARARYLFADDLRQSITRYPRLLLGSFSYRSAESTLSAGARPQPPMHGHLDLLRKRIAANAIAGHDTVILCDSVSQKDRLADLLEEELNALSVRLVVESLHAGFELPQAGIAIYTDHEIFDRFYRPSPRKRHRGGGMRLQELRSLKPGDFVVHVDYGVGRFAGFRKITVRDQKQDAIRVNYAGDDVLYVNVNALHKLHKYTGKEGHTPRLTKLGSGQWERARSRAKKRVKDIARDLIVLYARRKASKGHAFGPDTVWQREMEASFAFEDTPDQASASEAVKRDMEDNAPMDRLVCGDVGFGKTEVAIRAAFKAVQEGRQVAVLVPTTVLALQHLQTFQKRLDRFPVRVDMLSRFRSAAQQKKTLEGLRRGTVDIVVGTHRLVSKDVAFKDLGLLVIDEEQRFGVSVKERLRQLRVNVDTLTLTATPIPRTLQFSLMGARDLTIIGTAPPNRQRIVTEIHSFDRNLIRDAILYETARGGQVFCIHNRVQTIEDFALGLRSSVPGVRMQTAHGQMKPAQLERIMTEFIARRFDVLVSTTIIENGLDIPNANTIVVHNAHRFGLAELHQLRGRVGRSDRKAFCYLLVPSIQALTRDARRRLQAVEEFSDLGSGFQIAMRDLDIRGAGNILGGEQSGFIAEVGYDTYLSLLDEAVQELRHELSSDVFRDAPPPAASEVTVEIADEARLPDSYVTNNLERLSLYRRLSDAVSREAVHELRSEIVDRFGPLPAAAENLFEGAKIKLLAQALRLVRVQIRRKRLFLHMPPPEKDPHFSEHVLWPLIERLNLIDRRWALKETKKSTVFAVVQEVPDPAAAHTILEDLAADSVPA